MTPATAAAMHATIALMIRNDMATIIEAYRIAGFEQRRCRPKVQADMPFTGRFTLNR